MLLPVDRIVSKIIKKVLQQFLLAYVTIAGAVGAAQIIVVHAAAAADAAT